jgi:2-C-methyl-D-erythritol 4-phosphate cytidylyltransferase
MAVALIVAAGSGQRLGASRPKAFVTLAGRPMVEWSVDVFRSWEAVQDIVVALPPDRKRAPRGTIGVPGGRTRSESVKRALAAAPVASRPGEHVYVHDAARPLISLELLETLNRCRDDADAVTAASRITDTVKRTGTSGLVTETVDRDRLWAIETPQLFSPVVLKRALDAPVRVLREATDETSLVQRIGGTVALVDSGALVPCGNLKVTSPSDLRLAELILRDRA